MLFIGYEDTGIQYKRGAMENLNLDSDEPVIYTAGKLIINGVGHEAILTGKRLFLRESETGKAREDIPYSEIELAASGTNALREPVIFITARSPDGTTRETELIFFHQAGGQNVRDRDRCITILRDQKVRVAAGPSLAAPLPPGIRGTADTGTPGDEEPPVRPAVPEMSIYGMIGTTRQTQTKEPTDSTPVIMIAAALIVLVVLAAGIFFTGPGTGTGTGIRNLTQGTATVTAAVTSPEPEPDADAFTGTDCDHPSGLGPPARTRYRQTASGCGSRTRDSSPALSGRRDGTAR